MPPMPYWYVVHFKLQEDSYAWLAFFPIGSYIIGSMLTNRLLSRFKMDSLLFAGILLALVIGVTTLLLSLFSKPSLIMLNVLMTLFSVASGIVTPMSNANLMDKFRDKISIISAMISGLRVGTAGILVLIATNIPLYSYIPLAIYTISISIIALLCYSVFNALTKSAQM